MPRLLQINVTANWGSTGKIAEQIGLCAISKGWESYIAYGRYKNESHSYLLKIGSNLQSCAHYAEQKLLDNEGLCSRSATRKFIKEIETIKPDVIQLHNIHDHYLNYKLLFEYLNKTSIPVVWTFHDCWAFTGHCFHFVTKNCDRWKTECCDCPLNHDYPSTLLDHSRKNFNLKRNLFQTNRNLTIVACSDWMEKFVKESFLQGKRTRVIHNGIDLNQFRPISPKKQMTGRTKILAVSNLWNKDKGLYDIFELRRLLPEEFDITIVGLSEYQLKKLPKGITGLQRTQNVQELVRLYSEADVLINPTYADTFPTVNLEALACGTPVVTYRTGGSPEAIDDETGFVIEQGDVAQLAEVMRTLKESPLSPEACRKRVEMFFNKDKCFESYLEVYEDLLEAQ